MQKSTLNSYLVLIVGILSYSYGFSQETAKVIVNDSLKNAIDLKSVVITDSSNQNNTTEFIALTTQSTDEVIESLQGVNLIRRGNYAAEPTYRGMSSGQLSVTIDGMKIFGACTDKMDPVSSYVSSNNLESITVSSNSNHSGQGSNVGGGFDFQTKQAQFNTQKKLTGSAGAGYQTNGNGRIANLNLNYGDSSWGVNLNSNYQKFDNYNAGGGEEILYTQFEKINFSLSARWMMSSSEVISAQLIYDDAYNVGYPALPMDVSFAGGRIYSVSYKKYLSKGSFMFKAYGNNITHIMDDTKRAYVPMHMDMPGYSDTYGAYAMGEFSVGSRHTITINPDYYQNTSFADMKMYPNDPSRPEEPLMYMITWPDVKRHSTSLLLQDKFKVNKKLQLKYSGKLEYVTSKVFSDIGIQQLAILGQDGTVPSNYLLGNFDLSINRKIGDKWTIFFQGGYAERQPTVSEGFGYYLFNSMDGYDYIGQPDLKKEKASKFSLGTSYTKNKTTIEGQVYSYFFNDYIIGIIDEDYDGMTIGSNGVKVYENIPSANISGIELNIQTQLFKRINFQNITQYSYGLDNNNNPLQMIPPLQNITKLGFPIKKSSIRVESIIAASQNHVRSDAGETKTPSYGIININGQIPFTILQLKSTASVGINNLFDANYWSHLDWNSVPRTGRSFVFNLKLVF